MKMSQLHMTTWDGGNIPCFVIFNIEKFSCHAAFRHRLSVKSSSISYDVTPATPPYGLLDAK